MLVINDEKAWFYPFFVSFKMLIAIDIMVTADCYYIYRLIYFYKTQGKVLLIGQLVEWVEMNCNKAYPNIVHMMVKTIDYTIWVLTLHFENAKEKSIRPAPLCFLQHGS